MRLVLTLIAGSGARCGFAGLVGAVAASVPIAGDPVWLAPGEACDLFFEGGEAAAIERRARAVIAAAPVDVLVQPAAGRWKRLLVADMESTIVENEMLDELADFLGLRAQVSQITRRAMNGELDFIEALEARVSLLAGMEAKLLDEAAARIRITPGARALVATMRQGGALSALVSGGFTVFAERVARDLGFDRVVANRLELAEGRIAGRVRPPIVTRETKRHILLELAAECGIPREETLAVGDGANDLPMLEAAGLGIAFRAKPAVGAAAPWRVEHADLGALLYAQGYRRAEIVGERGAPPPHP